MAAATAKLSNLQISARKVRLVADLMRGQRVSDARDTLQFTLKGAAKPLQKTCPQSRHLPCEHTTGSKTNARTNEDITGRGRA